MNALKLQNGNILIPKRAEGDNGLIGDGMVELPPDHPEALEWINWYKQNNQEMPKEQQTKGFLPDIFDSNANLSDDDMKIDVLKEE